VNKRTFSTENVQFSACAERVLAKTVFSPEDLPKFDRSAVDGFAVLSRETFGASAAQPTLLCLAGEVKMGERAPFSIRAGDCALVWTGGELPQGADAMVMLEEAQALSGGLVAVESAAAPGRHVVFRGDDVRAKEAVFPVGKRLTSRDTGLLAALGIVEIEVAARPRVAILSTGDELIDPSQAPTGAQMRDANGPMLLAACQEAGASARFLGIVPDDEEKLLAAMWEASEGCDLLLLSGSSSAGAKDAAARCLTGLGEVAFHGLALKPGKPAFAGAIGETIVVGLPGHPAAAYLVFHALVRPLIAAMLGEIFVQHSITATLAQAAPSNHGREELLPVRLVGGFAEPVALKSGLISPLTRADGYIRIPRDTEGLPKGACVDVVLF
jgi:molybdenum cofactor synthesis domain-containing protein